MVNLDTDGALVLAAQVARQWLRDKPSELPLVADWLNLEPAELHRRLHPPTRRPPNGWSTTEVCPRCGAPLPERGNGAGRMRRWCSPECRWRASKERNNGR